MRRFLVPTMGVAFALLATPAAAQLDTTSSWPQVDQDPGLTRRAEVTGSQTGTPAAGFPTPIFGGSSPLKQTDATPGPPSVYVDGNILTGTNATNNNGVALLDYIYAADVAQPGTVN